LFDILNVLFRMGLTKKFKQVIKETEHNKSKNLKPVFNMDLSN